MGARKREAVIMVESSSCTARRMARIAGKAVVRITADTLVAVGKCVRVVVGMTVNTAESAVIRRSCMTIRAEDPCTLVFPGIDREIFSVVVKRGRRPCGCSMAGLAVGSELT